MIYPDDERTHDERTLWLREDVTQTPAVIFINPLGYSHESPYVSSSVETVLGCTKEEWLASSWWEEHLHPDDHDSVLAARQTLLLQNSSSRIEYRMTTGDGRLVWIGEFAQVVTSGGEPWMLQGLLEDITIRKLADEQLAFRASHDTLTGLPNRATFEDHLERALARAVRGRLSAVVLSMDIDGFREVNDRLGQEAGGVVLREVARRLAEAVRETDIVARQGRDEFLVLLADIEPGSAGWPDGNENEPDPVTWAADMVTERIRQAMKAPIVVNEVSLQVSVSVGRSIYPLDALDRAKIVTCANASMHRAKFATARER
ncbi:MAG: diguanylate cyclase domain-containing protein [Acidimicrobiales bacterium]|jgi:PAS domain S-box-containing protein